MTDTEIIKLVFGIFLSLGGAVLIFLAFALGYRYLIQEKRCTSRTKGIVKRYTISYRGGENSGVHLPVVYYTVAGKEYRVIGPKYKRYLTVSKSSPTAKNRMEYREDGQVFVINRTVNSFSGILRNPMQELYPLHCELDVYYDPNNPKLSYVLRYCNQKWIFWLMLICGISVLVSDVLILLLL